MTTIQTATQHQLDRATRRRSLLRRAALIVESSNAELDQLILRETAGIDRLISDLAKLDPREAFEDPERWDGQG